MEIGSQEPALVFGRFELRRAEKLLLENGQAVRLGSRALEVLCVLVERAGEIVSRDELVARVWPSTVVEETSLRVHVSALRRVLGDGQHGARYITNVPGRGYGFVAPIAPVAPVAPVLPVAAVALTSTAPGPVATAGRALDAAPEPGHSLPPRLTRALGRAEVITALIRQLAQHRLVSIVAAGGMGKTTVALAVAQQSLPAYADGIRFLDLAPLCKPAQLPAALGSTLGLTLPQIRPWTALAAGLCGSRMLLVLDNCEHLIDEAATLAECLLRGAPGVDILTTSREALGAEGERVHRLAALATPAVDAVLGCAAALAYPAVQLFVERAMANCDSFVPTERSLSIVRRICCRLEGIPLAIELAASRVDTLGLQGLAAHLDDPFRILMTGRRTSLPRHRTLHALLDWSHELLSEPERTVLRRLAVFRAGFTLESALRVVGDEALAAKDIVDHLISLGAKSLVSVDIGSDMPRYRLLYTTRLYAARKLAESGEQAAISRRHALRTRDLARACAAQCSMQPTASGLDAYRQIMDDVHAAFDWAFSADGEEGVGMALISDTLELRFAVGFFEDFASHVDLALDRAARLAPPQAELELRLNTAWCYLSGQSPPLNHRQADVFARTSALSEATGSIDLRINALHSMLVGSFGQGHYAQVREVVERLRPLATGDRAQIAVLVCDRFLLMALHYQGEHRAAKLLLESVAGFEASFDDRQHIGHVPRTVSMRIIRARIHWIEGQGDRALQHALEAVDNAACRHPFAHCQALGLAAIPIALWRGDDGLARQLVGQLLEQARPAALTYWQSFANSFARVLDLRRTPRALNDDFTALDWRLPANALELDLLATLSEELVSVEALTRAATGAVGWNAPEVIRANACARLAVGTIAVNEAQAAIERALQLARQQGALAWELRATLSLARLAKQRGRGSGRDDEARGLLVGVLARFDEGFDTADQLSASALLKELDGLAELDPQQRRKHG